jgi:hypothetical protein
VYFLILNALLAAEKKHDFYLNKGQTKPQLQESDLSKDFPQGRQRTKQTERQPRIVID